MKTLRLIFEFFSKNVFTTVIVVLVFSAVLYFANINIGIYRYTTYAYNMFVNAETKDSLYCMPSFDGNEMITSNDLDPYGKEIDKIEEQAKKYKAYTPFKRSMLINTIYNGSQIENQIFSKEMANECNIKLSEGNWNSLTENEKYISVIVSGKSFDNLNIGDIIDISLINVYSGNLTPIKVRVVGKIENPYMLPLFTNSGNIITSNNLYQKFEGMIFLQTQQFNDIIKKANSSISTQQSFMTALKSDANDIEKQEYIEFLKNHMSIATYDEILDKSIKNVDKELRTKIPIPMFLLSIVTLSLISVSVLFVNKKQREYSIYYLCGCSRVKTYFLLSCAITLMSFTGVLFNALLVVNADFLTSIGILTFNNNGVVYDEKSILFMLLCALSISTMSVALSILTFRKKSPIELYKTY